MIEFLQSYGIWILLAVFVILMMWMHAGGMLGGQNGQSGHGMGGGCGMGMSHDEHEHDEYQKPQAVPLDDRESSRQRVIPLKDEPVTSDVEGVSGEEAYMSSARYVRSHHHQSDRQ